MEARLLVYIVLVICPHFIVADQSKPLHANDKEEERWLHADECFSKAVERVEMRCKEMTEDEQFFLQFDFMNCYLRMMGLDMVLCEERTRQECSAVLNTPEHRLHDNIFQKFYHDLPTLCYHAANALWRKQMRSRVHNLQSFSDETLKGLLESLQLQEVLEQQQDRLLGNQERILQQGQEITRSVSQQRKEMNSSFAQLNSNLTDQASALRTFGSQLKYSLDRIHTVFGWVLGEVTGGIEVYVLLVCVIAMVTCLSAIRQAQGILWWTMTCVAAEIAFEVLLRLFLSKETLVQVVSLCRQLVVCAVLLLYLVMLLRRLLCPRVEDYDTELLIGRLSLQVQDMEKRLQDSGLLPSAPDTSPHLPQLSSSPRLGNESVQPGSSNREAEAPLPQPRDASDWAQQAALTSATIQFHEESAIVCGGGFDEVDSPVSWSSGQTRRGKVDNKQAEEEQEKGKKQSGESTRKKNSSGTKKKSEPFSTRRSAPSMRTSSDIAEDDSSLLSMSHQRYYLRTRRPLHAHHSPSNSSPQVQASHVEEALDEVASGSQSHRQFNHSPLAARVVKEEDMPYDTSMKHRQHSTATRSTRKSKPRARHSIL